MFCHKVPLSEKTTGERNSYARELREQNEGLGEGLGIGSELLECVTEGVSTKAVTGSSQNWSAPASMHRRWTDGGYGIVRDRQ